MKLLDARLEILAARDERPARELVVRMPLRAQELIGSPRSTSTG